MFVCIVGLKKFMLIYILLDGYLLLELFCWVLWEFCILELFIDFGLLNKKMRLFRCFYCVIEGVLYDLL